MSAMQEKQQAKTLQRGHPPGRIETNPAHKITPSLFPKFINGHPVQTYRHSRVILPDTLAG
jgi:hypothetical protein